MHTDKQTLESQNLSHAEKNPREVKVKYHCRYAQERKTEQFHWGFIQKWQGRQRQKIANCTSDNTD
ncbi:unnamed protein product [marine sediment metagenome]|uniref:Uncharacterized protein n=1 Tax=marine sediment metagenome TaxID=412755 RepID=X1AX07_9ZZZZ